MHRKTAGLKGGRLARHSAVAVLIGLGLLAGTLTAPPAAAKEQCRTKITIGKSVKGRAIVACQLGNPALRPMLFIGQMHGNEKAGLGTAATLMSTVVPNTANVWVIPTMNPDGNAWNRRQNAHGVDLNRNFPKDWKKRTGVYASGWKPASEPETRAVIGFIKTYKPYTSVIAHQPFNLVDISTGGDKRVSKRLADLSKTRLVRLDQSNAPGAHTYTGTLTSWANSEVLMSTAITYEFGSSVPQWRKEKLAWAVIVLAKERVKHRYGTRIGLRATASTIPKGTKVGLSGWMTAEGRDGWYRPASGRAVQIWAKVGTGSWKKLWSGTTRSEGRIWATFAQTEPTCYQAKYLSTGTWGSRSSPTACVSVK